VARRNGNGEGSRPRQEAADKLAKAIASNEEPHAKLVSTSTTVREFFAQYDDVVRNTMKRRSLETYRDIARLHLLPAFGNKKLKDLTREHVQRLYSQKRDTGLTAARVRRIHGVLSSVLNHAVLWRLVDHNVCKEVSPPKVPEIRPLNVEEARRFLTAARDDRHHALYVLGLTIGARLGELGGMFWSDLDLDRRVVRIQRALITGRRGQTFEAPKTPNSRRSIGLSQRATDALEHHRECQRAQGFQVEGDSLVFANTVGSPINPSHLLCRSFKPLLEKAGLPRTTFHAATRHTFCCLALQQGINARTISLAMGQSSVAFTLSEYASYIPNYGDTAVGLDEALG